MKKGILTLLAGMLMLGLVGCSSTPKENKKDEKVAITLWHTFTEHHEATLQEIIKNFNESQDQITVTALTQPLDGFSSKVYEAVSNGTGPDVVMLDASSASDYVDAGMSINFADYMDINSYKARVSEGLFNESTSFSDGGLHCLPIQSTGPVFYYNKTVYDQLGLTAPKTWTELAANSKKIYEETGMVGFALDSLADFGIMQLKQNGLEYLNAETKSVNWNDASTVTWLNYFAQGVKEGYFQLAPTTGDYNSGDISGHVLAAYIGSSAGVSYNNLGDDELACAPVPQTEGSSTPWVQIWTRNIIGFKSNETKEKAITEFALFFTNTENSAKWSIAFGGLSPYNDVESLSEYKDYVAGNIALQALANQNEYAGALPIATGSTTVRTEIEKMIKKVTTSQATPEQAITEAETTSNSALK